MNFPFVIVCEAVGLAYFKVCKRRTRLDLHGTEVQAVGIDEPKKTLTHCKIEWDGGVIGPRK